MAFPTVAARNESSTNTAGTSHIVSLPASIASGDLLVVIMQKGVTSATINALTGWTELVDESAVAAPLFVAYRVADGAEGATVTFTSSAATRDATVTYRITGHDAATAPQLSTVALANSNAPNATTCTPTGGSKDYLWITFFGMGASELADTDTLVSTTPTNYTNTLQKTGGTAGTNLGGLVASAERTNTAASEDAGAWLASITIQWRAYTLGVHPVGAFGGTATPAVIARSFIVETATASGPATVAPATIARTFVLPRPNPGFVPSHVAGLVLWLAGDNITGLNDGDPVTTWEDSSGSNDATQATSGKRPTYQTNELNGLAVVRFDGTDDVLVVPTPVSTATDNFTLFVLLDPATIDQNVSPVYVGTDPTDGWGIAVGNTYATPNYGYLRGGFGWENTGVAVVTGPQTLTLERVAGTWTVYKSGVPLTTSFSSAPTAPTAQTRIGQHENSATAFDGDIAEVLVYNAALSTLDRVTVEAYLRRKWLGGLDGNAFPAPIALVASLPAPTMAKWTLTEWMGRFDDADEDSATEIGVPFTTAGGLPSNGLWGDQDRWHPFRLRATIQAGASAVTVAPKLQYSIPGDLVDWTDLNTSSTVVRVYPSEYVTDGTATTAVAGVGTGTFIAGTVETSAATAGTVSLAAGEHTEVEWCVVNATASQGSEIWFRVADTGALAWAQLPIDEVVVCENPTYSQIEFRGRNDDGSQTTATWKAADNTNWSQVPDETFRCRFLIKVIQVHPSYRELFRLQRRVNAGAWDYVTTTSTVVKAVTSANFADEDTTTQQLSADVTFLPGRMSEDGVASDTWTFDWNPEQSFISANRTELEFALQIVDADTATSDVVQLRVVNYREAFTVDVGGAYTQTPSITVTAAAAGGTATPATIARSFTVETAGATGGGTVAPATLTGSFTVTTATATGGGTATPATIARAFTVVAPTVSGAGTATPASIARVFLQPTPSISAGSTLAATTIARSFLQPAPTLSAGSTVTAPLIARDLLLPAPAATGGGSATATPAVIALAFVLPAPTTSTGSSTAPTVIARAITLPAPTVTGGTGATAAPAVIAAAFLVVAPAVSVGSTLTPATIARSFLVPNPAASGGGSASVAPTVITGAFTLPAPALSTGSTATPAVIARSFLEPAPTVTGGGTATPATIARSIGVPNPSASGSSAGTATPATIARSFTQPAPSLSTGSSTTPATIARSVLVPAATATGGTAATPATIARQFLQPTPALSYGSTLTVTPVAVAVILPAPATSGGGTRTPAIIARLFALPAAGVSGGGTATPAVIALFVLLPAAAGQGTVFPDFAPYVRAYVLDARRAYRLTGARTYTVNGQRVYRR